MLSFICIAVPVTIAVVIQRFTQKYLSKILNISFFRLNVGDDACIEKLQRINKTNTIKAIVTFSSAVIAGIISSVIVYLCTLPPSS